jgi:hypothetical protein
MNDVFYAPALLLPLLAGGGWEGVKLLMEGQERPHLSPPLRAGEGSTAAALQPCFSRGNWAGNTASDGAEANGGLPQAGVWANP